MWTQITCPRSGINILGSISPKRRPSIDIHIVDAPRLPIYFVAHWGNGSGKAFSPSKLLPGLAFMAQKVLLLAGIGALRKVLHCSCVRTANGQATRLYRMSSTRIKVHIPQGTSLSQDAHVGVDNVHQLSITPRKSWQDVFPPETRLSGIQASNPWNKLSS